MNNDQFTPQEQALIQRLQNAPDPQLSPHVIDAIQQRVMSAVDVPVAHHPRHALPRTIPVYAALAAAAIVIILIVGWQIRNEQMAQVTTLTGTTAPTITVVSPSETIVPTTTNSPQPNIVPTVGSTVTPQATSDMPGTASPTANATSGVIIVVEGPVAAIQGNRVKIYDFAIELAPDEPMLKVMKVGDRLHIKGSMDARKTLIASEVSNAVARATGGTALVEGRVQAINGNVVTINGITIELSPNDPRLKTLRVGNYLSVSGNFERRGTMVVLIVVNLIIINDTDVDIFIWCREHHGMGMGMGMGEPSPPGMGMGMGEPQPPPGMGMGEPDEECRW
jgi:hypothetical protein